MTTTAAAKDLAAEWDRLMAEHRAIRRIPTADRSPAQAARLDEVYARLVQIAATPPDGYTLPKTAAALAAHAEAHGWEVTVEWSSPGWPGQPFLTVRVVRRERAGEQPEWKYEAYWDSRGCKPGHMRLREREGATPDHRAWCAPKSLKVIRDEIAQHPVPATAPEEAR